VAARGEEKRPADFALFFKEPVGETATQQDEHRVWTEAVGADGRPVARLEEEGQGGGGGDQKVETGVHVEGEAVRGADTLSGRTALF